jgi:hypothetical protein
MCRDTFPARPASGSCALVGVFTPQLTGSPVLHRAAFVPTRPILCREKNLMWRVLVPLLRFAFDCWLGLGVFALIASLVCGLSGIATLRHKQWLRSFHRYHARAIQELTKPPHLMPSSSGAKAVRRASRDSTSMTQKPVIYPEHPSFRPARTTIGGR